MIVRERIDGELQLTVGGQLIVSVIDRKPGVVDGEIRIREIWTQR